ncbi:hypothetical protein QNI16_21615 [Cytophagaceae bacterium YF14B1]|uniref:Uncharacterized protein n=1 Tax=Xanthocytophaga flava TaxID=3048013 RepID=A0AAE3QQP1_9BACT|nr:hypothetical protein [Xanthocytophaga flavus]MDJ1483111.1 hypothetical protein [Xanthocytophaga flavus]
MEEGVILGNVFYDPDTKTIDVIKTENTVLIWQDIPVEWMFSFVYYCFPFRGYVESTEDALYILTQWIDIINAEGESLLQIQLYQVEACIAALYKPVFPHSDNGITYRMACTWLHRGSGQKVFRDLYNHLKAIRKSNPSFLSNYFNLN